MSVTGNVVLISQMISKKGSDKLKLCRMAIVSNVSKLSPLKTIQSASLAEFESRKDHLVKN